MQIHVIQPGQTIWHLSRLYQIPAHTIMDLNAVSNPDQLVIGQALVMPTPRGTYVVQLNDTLHTIATTYGTTVSALAAINQIADPNQIYVGQVLQVPAPYRTAADVNAYLTNISARGLQTVQQLGPSLTYLSAFSYHVTADGSLTPLNDSAVLSAAQAQRIIPMLVISNWLGDMFNSDLAHTILSNPSLQQTVINNVLSVMADRGHGILNIDFEYVYPEDRQAYNHFLQNAAIQLHQAGYLVSTALAPKYSATQTGLLYEAHDYPVHGQLCDFVVLMTYEWGWIGGPPMAVSPVDEIQQVLDYAISVIPASKILMGVSVYGYDWKLPFVYGTFAQTLSPQGAVDRAAAYGASIKYHPTYQAPFYLYIDSAGSQHQVWFEDARSFQAKLNLVRVNQLRGISFWSYPTDFPQVPAVLLDNFTPKKP